jgi:hypothetical protein
LQASRSENEITGQVFPHHAKNPQNAVCGIPRALLAARTRFPASCAVFESTFESQPTERHSPGG